MKKLRIKYGYGGIVPCPWGVGDKVSLDVNEFGRGRYIPPNPNPVTLTGIVAQRETETYFTVLLADGETLFHFFGALEMDDWRWRQAYTRETHNLQVREIQSL